MVVVTDHASVTPPTDTVAVRAVLVEFAEVNRTANVCPFVIVPDVPHAPPLMLICGDPAPLTDADVDVFSPLIVTVFDVLNVFNAAPVTSVKVKALGVVSHAVCCVQVPLL